MHLLIQGEFRELTQQTISSVKSALWENQKTLCSYLSCCGHVWPSLLSQPWPLTLQFLACVQQRTHPFPPCPIPLDPVSVYFISGLRFLTLSLLWRLGLILGLCIIRFSEIFWSCVSPSITLPPRFLPPPNSFLTSQLKWKIQSSPQSFWVADDGFCVKPLK